MKRLLRLWSRWRQRPRRRSEEYGELRQAVAAAVLRLRELGLTGSRRRRRSRAPWYVLLGEPQSGKSAALRALDFEPLLAASAEPAPRLVSGWCSGEAVCWELSAELLEPGSGRPDLGDAARELARWRSRLPLDGVLVAVSAQQLLQQSAAERGSWLRRLRGALDGVQQRLECELPVYLLLTQVDRLPGCVALLAHLDAEQREAPWGASWQERVPEGGSFGARVAAEWALLARVLHARLLRILGGGSGADVAALFGFGARFAELGAQLSHELHQLSEAHPCRPRVLLRGFYLCSAQPPQLRGQRSGWFCRELFQRAILSDRGSVRLPQQLREREQLRRLWQRGALLLAAALVCWPAVRSRSINLELIESTSRSLQLPAPAPPSELSGARSEQGAELDLLLPQLERLESAAQRFQVRHWWGPYAALELQQRVARRYGERLQALVQGPLREQLQAELRAVGDVARFDWHNFRQAADTLKLYLMLTDPARLDAGWAAPRLLHSWQRARERGACGGTGPLLPHIERWLRSLAADPALALPGSETLVASARSRLSGLPVPELGLASLLEAARAVPDVRPAQLLDASTARAWAVPGDVAVPGVYTRAGWELLRPSLPEAVFPAADAWIFGRPLPEAWSSERVQQLHLAHHAHAWRALFLSLGALARSAGTREGGGSWGQQGTLERIMVAAQPDAPLARLLQQLAQNVRFPLAEPAAALAQQAASQLKYKLGAPPEVASPLEREFAGVLGFAFAEQPNGAIAPGSALAEYQQELRALLASLQAPGAAEAAHDGASAQLRRVASTVERLLGTLTRADRELLEGLLLEPIEQGLAQLRWQEQLRLAELWREQVAQPLGRMTALFPFRASSSEDVELSELQALLEPRAGALWRLVDGELASRVQESGGRFQLLAPPSGEAALSPALPSCLSAARALQQLLFAPEAGNVSVRLSSNAGGAAALSLTVDDQKLEPAALDGAGAEADPSWLTLSWPGKGGQPGAALQLRTGPFADELRRTGSFGWLRLLLEGGLRATGGTHEHRSWEASWGLQHGQTRVFLSLRARGPARVPSLGLFQGLECPAELFSARRGGAT